MTVTQIRYAIAVAETGSMTKAAKHIGVRQPSVSSAISDLVWRNGISPLYSDKISKSNNKYID